MKQNSNEKATSADTEIEAWVCFPHWKNKQQDPETTNIPATIICYSFKKSITNMKPRSDKFC